MSSLKETVVVLKKPNGETLVVHDPDHVTYPDSSQPYWIIVKDKNEIRTTGEVWVERALAGNEVVCQDSVVCTGIRCFHKFPHPKSEECGKVCTGLDRAQSCRPYRI